MASHWLSRAISGIALAALCGVSPVRAGLFERALEGLEESWVEPSEGTEETEEEFETDRDSFTPAANTVAKGRILFEAAHSYIDNRSAVDSHSFPEFLARYGLTERLELRFGANYEVGGGGDVTGADSEGDIETAGSESEAKVLYGFKYALTDQEGWLPESAVILMGSTPTAGPEDTTSLVATYVFGWTLSNDWKLDASMRYANPVAEGDAFSQWAPSIVLKVPVCEKWDAHVEYFGIFTEGKFDERNGQYVSPGLHYLLTPRCEIGFRLGWGLNNDASKFFSNVGIGYLF